MENARDSIPASDEPAFAGAEGAAAAVAGGGAVLGADLPPVAAAPDPAPAGGGAPAPAGASRARRAKQPPDEQQQLELRISFNNRISHLCKLAALVICIVIFATTVLGQDNMTFVILGLSLSVALLAIALLQDAYHPRR